MQRMDSKYSAMSKHSVTVVCILITYLESNGLTMDRFTENKCNTLKIWISLKRTDLNETRITVLKDVYIPREADSTTVKQILIRSFGVSDVDLILKLRNNSGFLIPINSDLLKNSKQTPYILEVVHVFQHVVPKPRTVAMIVINKSLKSRLQSITKRIERLEAIIPEIKLRHQEKISKEIALLNQKLNFLNQRMLMADSHHWKGMFKRPPLW
ncbi:uncharacterized protein LOC122800030 [Protopterus annectens]|uniref:uncharacterized protein LOC122800030 n=1 Tax=Protopterus annectens TaxID=7888 RepID=UPI001CFA71BF|nr:uncharacterized protein LOC122800030 [Protopterus annectens]